jgi:hypothetical protein
MVLDAIYHQLHDIDSKKQIHILAGNNDVDDDLEDFYLRLHTYLSFQSEIPEAF